MSNGNANTENLSMSYISETNEPPKRLVSAPTMYCIFALGVIFVVAGTLITAYSYVSASPDIQKSKLGKALRIVGPIVLGCGGACLLGMSIMCIVVCSSNKKQHKLYAAPFFSIGQNTTFFDRRLIDDSNPWEAQVGIQNEVNPIQEEEEEDPLKFIVNTVANERKRRQSRKLSHLTEVNSNAALQIPTSISGEEPLTDDAKRNLGNLTPALTVSSQKVARKGGRFKSNPENIGTLKPMESEKERAAALEALLQETGLSEKPPPSESISRSRSYSMLGPRPLIAGPSAEPFLRRTATVTSGNSQLHLQEIRKRELQRPIEERQNRHTKKKKKSANLSALSTIPQIHDMPSYSPEVLESLIGMADQQNFHKSVSFHSKDAMLIGSHPEYNMSLRKGFHQYDTSAPLNQFPQELEAPVASLENLNHPNAKDSYQPGSLDGKLRKKRNRGKGKGDASAKTPRRMMMGVSSLKRSNDDILQESEMSFEQPYDDSSESSSSTAGEISSGSLRKSRGETLRPKTRRQRIQYPKIKEPKPHTKHPTKKTNENLNNNGGRSDSEGGQSSECSCSSCADCGEVPPPPSAALAVASGIMGDLKPNAPVVSHRSKVLSVIRSSGDSNLQYSEDESTY